MLEKHEGHIMVEEKKVQSLTGYPQPIAAALWRMQNARERTLEALAMLPEAALDWHAAGLHNSIGTLLYHIAAIEIDWLYDEILRQDWLPEIEELFPYPVRNEAGQLYQVTLPLNEHLARLAQTRQYFLEGLKTISLDDYYHLRAMPHYHVSPEWVLHHLAQHEAEHRGEILTILTLYQAQGQRIH